MMAKFHKLHILPVLGIALAALAALAMPASAQQILLDKPVRAGELTLFPDLNDATAYYYVSDKPHLATDENGKPQFSFLRYVDNVRTGPDQPEAREGAGGAIVHAVVALAVSKEQIRDAQRELARLKPGAKIQGPVVYKSGRFGLITSFRDTQGGLTTQVVGLGAAPIMDEEKAAVSMQLTKQGAKVLWESFNTTTPDISFSFEMVMDGFRSPHQAVIDADFDQIYQHQAFSAGLATTYLSAEIKAAFDDLVRSGAIKVSQVGSDEKLDALTTTAYNKLIDMMFAPAGGAGTPDPSGASGGQGSILDRATAQLQRSRQEADQENQRIRNDNHAAGVTSAGGTPVGGASTARPATSGTAASGVAAPGAAASGVAASRTSASGAPAGGTPPPSSPAPATTPPAATGSTASNGNSGGSRAPGQQEVAKPSFAIALAYEMKNVHQHGHFHIDLNKFSSDSLNMRFDENIGDLTSLKGDPSSFREVNLDDPLFNQREIVAFVDGLNAQDFGQYINFVNVRLRKTHAGGDLTNDEVRIDRNNFNKQGNNFKLLYGWKGDNDRSRWMNYEYQTSWSFFGGKSVDNDWKPANGGAIDLAPPYQRRTVELQADPGTITAAGVRSITVKFIYDLGGSEQTRAVTLNAAKGQLSDKVEFMLPANQYDYQYEITWRLKGNRVVSSGRQTANDAILFVDNLP